MALIDSGKIHDLAEAIVPASSSEARADAVAGVETLCTKILEYIVANAEVTISTGSLIPTIPPLVIVPMDGGASLAAGLLSNCNDKDLTEGTVL